MRSKKFTILTALIMVFIFVQSALPSDLSSAESGVIVAWIIKTFQNIIRIDRETLVVIVRKGAHFSEYAVLGCSLVAAVGEWKRDEGNIITHDGLSNLLPAWVIGTLYAVTDEFHQRFVSGRSCELRDMMIDSCGVICGALAAIVVTKIRRSNRK